MEYRGLKLDLIGLAAVIAAITALYSKVKAHNKRKGQKHDEKDSDET
jgi:mannose/fructose/N-acetylgalactosamine-specific phosphotransferase system component IIC